MTCPHCAAVGEVGAAFCENCGKAIGDAAAGAPGVAAAVVAEASPFDDLGSGPISAVTGKLPLAVDVTGKRPCFGCGGAIDADGYCEQCGTKQPSERDHFRETPAPWVGGVCDRGIVHGRNEDAMALLADQAPGSRAVLVVLDGVSSSIDSDVGSLAGARAARDSLLTPLPRGLGTEQGRAAAVVAALSDTVRAANDAIVRTTAPDSPSPASATFVVAVVEGNRLSVANIGDSRVYWMPDASAAVQLTVDDSAAEQLIAAGVDRATAENGPQGHAITRWLGRDAPDLTPRVVELDLTEPGWVLACSDGLWNYASEAPTLSDHLRAAVADGATDPEALALALVAFANGCGGRDNITVALARIGPPAVAAAPAGHNAAPETVEVPVAEDAAAPTSPAPAPGSPPEPRPEAPPAPLTAPPTQS